MVQVQAGLPTMDDKGRPFSVSGNLNTVKSKESHCQITCPGCSFIFYTFHKPGSCLAVICTECQSKFMGVVNTVNCGECEERLKCYGLRPIPFLPINPDKQVKITVHNTVMPSGQWEVMMKACEDLKVNGIISF